MTSLTLPSSRRCSRSRLRSAGQLRSVSAARSVGLGVEDPLEAEQLVLDLVELAGGLGDAERGVDGELLERVEQVTRLRPARARRPRAAARVPGASSRSPNSWSTTRTFGRVERPGRRARGAATPARSAATTTAYSSSESWREVAVGSGSWSRSAASDAAARALHQRRLARAGMLDLDVSVAPTPAMKSATSLRCRASLAQRVVDDPLGERRGELADLVAQREDRLLPLGGDPLRGGGEHLLDPRLRLAARLLDDLGALGLRLLAQPDGLATGLGQRLGVVLLRRLEPLLGRLGVLELLAGSSPAARRSSSVIGGSAFLPRMRG